MQNITFWPAIVSSNSVSILSIVWIIFFEGFDSSSYNAKNYLFGHSPFDINKNKFILEATLFYTKSTERFSGSLFE